MLAPHLPDIGDTTTDLLALRAYLLSQRATLTTLARHLERVVPRRHGGHSHGWHGPASYAFDLSVARLRNDARHVVEQIERAGNQTEQALWEIDHCVR